MKKSENFHSRITLTRALVVLAFVLLFDLLLALFLGFVLNPFFWGGALVGCVLYNVFAYVCEQFHLMQDPHYYDNWNIYMNHKRRLKEEVRRNKDDCLRPLPK